MSASQLRSELRQAKEDNTFTSEQLAKERTRADKAEKKLKGHRPETVPLSERITPMQKEITDIQSIVEKGIVTHISTVQALDVWWTEEVTSRPGYDPNEVVEMPRDVGLVLMHLVRSAEGLASLVGALQHALDERFASDIMHARQYLMQEQADGAANDAAGSSHA
jgi:hypothetical protein